MFHRPLFIVFCFLATMLLRAQDTLHLRSHDRVTVVTDPSTGMRYHTQRVAFPSVKTAIRKTLLTVDFGCPDGMRCADWDYLDHVLLHPVNGPDTFEVARMLTPYGGLFKKDWRFAWTGDVTDFSSVLRDSVEVIYAHSGYEPNEDRGWAVTLDFTLVKGPPVADVLSIRQLYRGHFKYGDAQRNVEEDMVPRAFLTDPKAAMARIRVQQTGHGMHADDGCGEFCSKWRSVKFDGKEVDRRKLWKKCGDNPLSPQAGTWIYDRAAWCPGELQQPDVIDILLKPAANELERKHTVDIDMEPYVHDSTTAFTDIAAYLVQLAAPRAKHDASVEAILVPNDDPIYGRFNPAIQQPRIIIRNNGSEALDAISITYGTDGFRQRAFALNRRLKFGESTTIILPHLIEMKPGTNRFTVTLGDPNGRKDAWRDDNALSCTFTAADVLDTVMILQLRTNAEPWQNSVHIEGTRGNVILDRPLGSLRPDTLYTDTLHMPAASYEFQLADTAGNGLEFWNNVEGGRGFVRLLNARGELVKRFGSDHGNGLHYAFRTTAGAMVPTDSLPAIGLFPTRTTGRTKLDVFANAPGLLTIRIMDEKGGLVEEIEHRDLKEAVLPLDLTKRGPQRYTITVLWNGTEAFSSRLRVVEQTD